SPAAWPEARSCPPRSRRRTWPEPSTPPAGPTPTCSSGRAASTGCRTSCSGRSPTRSCSSCRRSGPTSRPGISTSPWRTSSAAHAGSGASSARGGDVLSQRILTAVVGVPVLVACVGWAPGWLFTVLALGLCYCAWLLGHVVWLRDLPDGRALTLFALGVTWCGESGAFFVGRRVGRHKLAPRVSPGKTVEGAAAQVAVSTLAAVVAAPAV